MSILSKDKSNCIYNYQQNETLEHIEKIFLPIDIESNSKCQTLYLEY